MSEEIKKGLLGIVVDETTISHVVPELSTLTYRGYTVQELCDKCDFEEVAYLVLNGDLPNKKQLKKFIKEERSERRLSKQILRNIQLKDIKNDLSNLKKASDKTDIKIPKRLSDFKKLLNSDNFNRFSCIFLPFDAVIKALKL